MIIQANVTNNQKVTVEEKDLKMQSSWTEAAMMCVNRIIVAYALFPLFVAGDTNTQTLCSNMLTDFKACFAGELPPERLINEWKWGDINLAFAFDFGISLYDEAPHGAIFVAGSPATRSTQLTDHLDKPDPEWEYPKVGCYYLYDGKPYLRFGVKKVPASGERILTFLICAKKNEMYPHFLSILGLQEPSYEKMRAEQPSQYWDTEVYNQESFQHFHEHYDSGRVDDQFVRWGALTPEVDVVYRFNRKECTGVMLIRRDSIFATKNPEGSHRAGTLDLRKFTEGFIWAPGYLAERFAEEIAGRLIKDESHPFDFFTKRMAQNFKQVLEKYKDNTDFIRNLRLLHLGVVRTPSMEVLDAPWPKFSYYKSASGALTLRGKAEGRNIGYRYCDEFDSFVLNVEGMGEDAQVLLPNDLDIKPYLHAYPSNNVLYEHVRADKRFRIIVQPYIAYLYKGSDLVKILVCKSTHGPADHGWSLQRGYYCYEGMPAFYWPVPRAYSPLETN